MAHRYLLESGSPDGYRLEDGSGVLSIDGDEPPYVLRSPLVTPRPARRVVQQPSFLTNLLLTTLAVGSVAAPFTPARASQPGPQPKVSYHAALQPAAPARFGLATLAQNPFAQEDWQNPRGPKPVTAGMERGVDLATLALTPFTVDDTAQRVTARRVLQPDLPPSFDRTPAGPAPFTQDDWPNPLRAKTSVVPVSHRPTVDPETPPPPVGTPFVPVQFQNPAKRAVKMAAVGIPAFDRSDPFFQEEWPQPIPRKRVVQPDQFQAITRSAVAPASPFAQSDWPNPARKRLAPEAQPPQVFDRTAVVAPAPFTQTDWANPVRPRPIRPVEISPVFDRTAAPIAAPFAQTEWPNPAIRPTPSEWGTLSPINYDAFVSTPIPEPPAAPSVIIIGGDDAPRKKPKNRRERHDLFQAIEATVHGLLHPVPANAGDDGRGVEVLRPDTARDAGRKIDELLVLAEGQQRLLQRAAALRAELRDLEAAWLREQDDEDALIWLF